MGQAGMAADSPKLKDTDKLLILLGVAGFIWLLTMLSSVLTPFFVAALLAYLGDPLADRLEAKGLSRTLSVILVFLLIFVSGLTLLLIFVPMLSVQLVSLLENLPSHIQKIQTLLQPLIHSLGISPEQFDMKTLRQALEENWSKAGEFAGQMAQYMTRSGMAIIQWLINLVLIPVLTFYLLRDWDVLKGRVRELIPRRHEPKITAMTGECDDMLAGFLRGQLMVMLALSVIYVAGLTVMGLELALLIGVIAGIVSFVPYLGLFVGLALAGVAAYLQFQEWLPLLFVALIFGAAQLVEAMFLTPRFVGERIGLHPVAVIFAVMAGGALFGFTGVLLALPVAAVVMVMMRHAHDYYTRSDLYS